MIAASEVPLASLTPADGIALMTRFFAEGMTLTAGWGIRDHSGDESYGLRMSVEFDTSPGDSVHSVSLLFKVGPRSLGDDFPGEKMHWCPTPDDIPAFRSGLEESAPFQVWGRSRAADVSLIWEDEGELLPEPPVQPGDRMTAEEWRCSEDPVAMLRALRASWPGEEAALVRLTHRYLLACCRAIRTLLPMEASRRGVEVAERLIEGGATREEFGRAEWEAEGAAFFLDPYEHEPEDQAPEAREARRRYEADRRASIGPLAKQVEAMPPEELRRLVRPEATDEAISPRQLLADAAYFADSAMAYPGIRPRASVIRTHRKFLSAALLREIVGDVFHPESS